MTGSTDESEVLDRLDECLEKLVANRLHTSFGSSIYKYSFSLFGQERDSDVKWEIAVHLESSRTSNPIEHILVGSGQLKLPQQKVLAYALRGWIMAAQSRYPGTAQPSFSIS